MFHLFKIWIVCQIQVFQNFRLFGKFTLFNIWIVRKIWIVKTLYFGFWKFWLKNSSNLSLPPPYGTHDTLMYHHSRNFYWFSLSPPPLPAITISPSLSWMDEDSENLKIDRVDLGKIPFQIYAQIFKVARARLFNPNPRRLRYFQVKYTQLIHDLVPFTYQFHKLYEKSFRN